MAILNQKLTIEQYQKYERYYVQREEVFIKKERSIAQIEKLCFALNEKNNDFWNKNCRPLISEIFKAGGKAHCKIKHKYDDSNGKIPPYWLYTAHNECGLLAIGFDWEFETPKNPINLGLGQEYYNNSQINGILSGRVSKFQNLFYELLDQWLFQQQNKPKDSGITLKLNINNRIYWFVSIRNKHGVLYWRKVVDPNGQPY